MTESSGAYSMSAEDTDPVRVRIEELRALLAKATKGPWQLQDGCSWRRIGTHFHDGDVLCPTVHVHDGHPDLMSKGGNTYANLNLIVAAVNALPVLLDRLETLETTARAVVAKLDALGPDPGGFIAFGQAHGLRYSGPTYGAELEALRAALGALT